MGDYICIIIYGLTYFMSWNSIIRTVNSLQAGCSKIMLTTYLLLIWRLRIAGTIFHLFHMPAWSAEEQLYLTLPMNFISCFCANWRIKKPTRCHLIFYYTYRLNMFRACSSTCLSLQPGHYFSLTASHLQHTANQEQHDQCGKQHHSRELLMMGIVMIETCWAYKKYNKISSGI